MRFIKFLILVGFLLFSGGISFAQNERSEEQKIQPEQPQKDQDQSEPLLLQPGMDTTKLNLQIDSIYLDEETNILFASQKQSGNQSSQDLGQNPVVQKWWAYMADIMETNPDNSPVTIPLEEVFYME